MRSPQSLSLLFLLAPLVCHGMSLSEETGYSAMQFAQSVYADGDIGGSDNEDEDSPFAWKLAYSYQKMITPNDGASAIIDKTYSYTGGLSWSGNSEFSLGAKLNYSNTPNEELVVRGGQLTGAYRWVYAGPNEVYFSPYLNFKLLGSSSDYLETYSGQVARKRQAPKKVAGTSELRQSMLGLDLTWKPVKTWKFDFEWDHYSYNRDVVDFQNQLDSPASLQRGMNGFTNTVGGVAHVSYNLNVTWDFVTNWRVYVSEQYSILAADNSVSTSFKTSLSDQFSKNWKATLGLEHESSNVFVDTLAILGVECEI